MTDEEHLIKSLTIIRNDFVARDLLGYAGIINESKKLIEKKNKMIDLMAEQLTSPINGKEWVIKYYEDRVENEKNV